MSDKVGHWNWLAFWPVFVLKTMISIKVCTSPRLKTAYYSQQNASRNFKSGQFFTDFLIGQLDEWSNKWIIMQNNILWVKQGQVRLRIQILLSRIFGSVMKYQRHYFESQIIVNNLKPYSKSTNWASILKLFPELYR